MGTQALRLGRVPVPVAASVFTARRLMLVLENLESRFAEHDVFLAACKQSLQDARARHAEPLTELVGRVLEAIARRASTLGGLDEVHTYFASDLMVVKVRRTTAVTDPDFAATRPFCDRTLPSESPEVYRSEYLAARLLAEHDADSLTGADLVELARRAAEAANDDGYERGVHDHDAAANRRGPDPHHRSRGQPPQTRRAPRHPHNGTGSTLDRGDRRLHAYPCARRLRRRPLARAVAALGLLADRITAIETAITRATDPCHLLASRRTARGTPR